MFLIWNTDQFQTFIFLITVYFDALLHGHCQEGNGAQKSSKMFFSTIYSVTIWGLTPFSPFSVIVSPPFHPSLGQQNTLVLG